MALSLAAPMALGFAGIAPMARPTQQLRTMMSAADGMCAPRRSKSLLCRAAALSELGESEPHVDELPDLNADGA